jgi:type I restriction enzyme S subunit
MQTEKENRSFGWQTVMFEKAFEESTAGQPKVPKSQYQVKGIYPIIDQGQNYLAGYTDDTDALYKGRLPVIIFGDHTRVFKYVDHPFCLGADGSKVLLPKSIFIPKYLYYYFSTTKIPNLGYSRHSKVLREILVPRPLLFEQRRIVEIIDQTEALRKKRAEADEVTEKIFSALFYRSFGNPNTNSHNLPERNIGSLITSVARKNPSDDPYSTFKYIDIAGVDGKRGSIMEPRSMQGFEAPSRARQVVRSNDVIVSTVRPYLRATALVPDDLHNEICSTGFCVLRAKNNYGYGFLYVLTRLSWFTEKLNGMARGASYPAVTDSDIFNIDVPYKDDELHLKRFDSEVTIVLDNQRKQLLLADKIESIYNVLLHRAFSGDLTAKWREAHMRELLQEMEKQDRELEKPIEK